ncbi:Gamma-glutamyltranspeptidase precursor [Leclercia adecarboxylata]|uniref:Gamma-glutamyltranspeptidase n=1 Tax=Leclercia adecarboxylata TaxID=83655 RepID=A0A4V6YYC7_9ENTR|nr:Gamma-glutamyltranspeptidase precursor [Leclercia adecarboxylata]
MVDKDGNAVAVTYTLNTTFGTGIVAGNSGILLNNEMDDFSAKPGVPNVYGWWAGMPTPSGRRSARCRRCHRRLW